MLLFLFDEGEHSLHILVWLLVLMMGPTDSAIRAARLWALPTQYFRSPYRILPCGL